MAATPVPLEIEVPSDIQYIEGIVAEVVAACERCAFPRRQLALNVPVALTEALSNAMLRGNGEDRSKTVRVRVAVDDRRLVIDVADQGLGFDLDACTEDPATPAALAREDGRGLFLMRSLMDRVERFTDGGNVVRLVLHRA